MAEGQADIAQSAACLLYLRTLSQGKDTGYHLKPQITYGLFLLISCTVDLLMVHEYSGTQTR